MVRFMALRQRAQLTTLLAQIVHDARQVDAWREPDRRNLQTWRQVLFAVMVHRTTRLLTLAQALVGRRRASTVKSLALGLGYVLARAQCDVATLSPCLLQAALAHVAPTHCARYGGKAVLVIDTTDYPKRSRGTGKRDHHMQHIGRVRKTTHTKETTYGYADSWAGVVLKGNRFLPLARELYTSTQPYLTSQNQVEERVLATAHTMLTTSGVETIVVADRGFGRKPLLIRLAQASQDFVIRIDSDSTVYRLSEHHAAHHLADLLAPQAWLGEVVWNRGEAGTLRCRIRKVRARIYDGRGRKADWQAASMTFVEVVPNDTRIAPFVVATTLPIWTAPHAQGVVHIYAQRWAIEAGFETMKAWGLGRFMVRQWQAIDRLLWIVAVAYALATIALYLPKLAVLRQQAVQCLRQWGVGGRRLSVGKLAEAIAIDVRLHRRAWCTAWRL